MSAAIIEIKPRTVTAGKFLKRPASSLCSRRNVRPSITHRNARVVSPGEIRIPEPTGNVERVIPFNDTNRKL